MKLNSEWHPIARICYWIFVCVLCLFVLNFFSAPLGLFGSLADAQLKILTPKYVTLIVNTFSMLGGYVVIRLLLSLRYPLKNLDKEVLGVLFVIYVSLTSLGLLGARCDIYVFCWGDVVIESDCEVDWDRQGGHCK